MVTWVLPAACFMSQGPVAGDQTENLRFKQPEIAASIRDAALRPLEALRAASAGTLSM